MRKRLVINAEISQFDFLKNKSLNGDTETLKIIFEYFKSKKFIINIIITEKVWTKKDYNFRKEFENLKNKGVIEDFIFIDLKNSTHEKKPNNFLEYLKIKYTVKKEVKLYSYKFSNIINHIKPDFVFSFMDIFPVNYKSISPLVVWGLHNSDFVLKYNFEKKKKKFFT